MADNIPVEVQIKDLEKTMGTIVRALKELKASVKVLEEKENRSQSDEIQEIVKSQKTLEEIITTNAIAIKRIDEEIKKFQTNKEKIESSKDETNKVENEDKNVDISTEDTVNSNWSVNFHTQQTFAKLILKERNVIKICVK